MSVAKIAISVDPGLVRQVDRMVKARVFRSRSEAFQLAVREKISRMDRTLFEQECKKLNVREEQRLADDGLATDLSEWPEY